MSERAETEHTVRRLVFYSGDARSAVLSLPSHGIESEADFVPAEAATRLHYQRRHSHTAMMGKKTRTGTGRRTILQLSPPGLRSGTGAGRDEAVGSGSEGGKISVLCVLFLR